MATTTSHFGIIKPASNEKYSLQVVNTNSETIDNQMYNNQQSAAKIMVGASANADGQSGRVPAPLIADKDKYLKGDGTWDTPSGSSTLDGLTDVTITTPTNGQVLVYDSANSIWKNGNGSGGGGSSTFAKLAQYSGAGTGYDANDTINLSDSVTNYDILLFSVLYTATEAFSNAVVAVDDFKNKYTTRFYVGYNSAGYADVKYATDTSISVIRTNNMYINSVYGIKF